MKPHATGSFAGACPIVVIGASTGGTRVLPSLLAPLMNRSACIVIVQHMPKYINESVLRTLSRHSTGPVKLVETGDRIEAGRTFVAPSDVHCRLVKNQTFQLEPGPMVNYVCPAIDVTMQSLLCPVPRQLFIGVVLTGMGKDGAEGLVHMKRLGALTIAQNQATCAVYGMPAEAVKRGCVDHILPPAEIARLIASKITLSD